MQKTVAISLAPGPRRRTARRRLWPVCPGRGGYPGACKVQVDFEGAAGQGEAGGDFKPIRPLEYTAPDLQSAGRTR